MSFSLECSGLAVARVLRGAALLLHAVLSWALFSYSSSSFSFLQYPSSRRPRNPISAAIKENLHVATYADLRREETETTTTCAVCLGDVRPRDEVRELRNCRHVFHRGCLDRWLDHDDRGTCPLCRAPLLLPPPPEPPVGPSWEVERLLYLFGDDLMLPAPSSYAL